MSKNKKWTHVEVEYVDENEFPKNIYEVESPRQLERWLKDIILDAYNYSTEKAIGRIVSMVERNKDESLTMAREVSDFISTSQGTWFYVGQIYSRLHLTSRQEKKNVVTCLLRERDKGVVKSHSSKNGWYRQIISESEALELDDTPEEEVHLEWPLSMNELNMDFCPGDIILIAGDQNAGKTTWLLNFIKLNMDKHNIFYYTSEMGKQRLKRRLREFQDVEKWNFKPFMRTGNFADAVAQHPNDINIIDFLEIHENFYEVGGLLFEIWQETIGGITIVAIQKDAWSPLGRGKSFGKEKPVLYLTIDFGKIKIIKAKSWKGKDNPNWLAHDFKILNGAEFLSTSGWYQDKGEQFSKGGKPYG